MSRMSDPSSSRMFDLIFPAMYIATLSASGDRFGFRFLLEDGHVGFKIRRLDVGRQSPFEPRSKALLERRDLVRRAVAAEHDLLSASRKAR